MSNVRRPDATSGNGEHIPSGELEATSRPVPLDVTVDDPTAPTLAWLRTLRARHRARTFGYLAYVAVVFLASWYGSYAGGLLLQIDQTPLAQHATIIRELLPAALPVIGLLALLLAVLDGLHRGPVAPPRPDTDWLLALPIRHRPALLPWFTLAAGVWVLAGALVGVAAALLLAAAGLGALAPLTLAGLLPGCCLGALAAAVSTAVEAAPRLTERLRRLGPLLCTPVVLLGIQAACAAAGQRSPLWEQLVGWSGPWGWAAAPLLGVVDAPGAHPGVALALLFGTAALGLAYAARRLDALPAARLRAAARTGAGLVAGVLTADVRAVRLAFPAAPPRPDGRLRARVARLRPPRRRGLLVPWRDTVALLRAPSRVCSAAFLLLLGFTCLLAAAPFLTAFAALAGYGAATTLLEPARLDADDVRRSAWSARPFRRLALAHGVVPTLVLLALGGLLAIPATLLGHPSAPLAVLTAVPVLVATALAATYRGPVPVGLLFGGAALADAGPLLTALWHLLPPLLACALLAVLRTAVAPVAPPLALLAAGWFLAGVCTVWAGRRARRLGRG